MEMNLYEAIKDRKKYLSEKKVKLWMYQILKALDFMHRNGIFHRDIKPENILLNNGGVKLADLGSCKGMYSKAPFTEYISTRWYRAPECLLTDGYYNYKMDIWGLGCVYFEILTLIPLFPGDDEIDEVKKINQILGSPNNDLYQKLISKSTHCQGITFEYEKGTGIDKFLPHVSNKCIDIIKKMLIYDPEKRYTAKQCLNHEYFRDLLSEDLKFSKLSQGSFQHDPSLLKSFYDPGSLARFDDSVQIDNQILNNSLHATFLAKKERENNFANNSVGLNKNLSKLPEIAGSNVYEGENSFNGSFRLTKNNDKDIKLPKIQQFLNSNEFKIIRRDMSNHSIEKMFPNNFTLYQKKPQGNSIKKRINEIKKNYVSPYSKRNLGNCLMIA